MCKKEKNGNTQSDKFHRVILALTKEIVKCSGLLHQRRSTKHDHTLTYYCIFYRCYYDNNNINFKFII